jgi:hypothetical protein
MVAPDLIIVDGTNAFNSVGRILKEVVAKPEHSKISSYLEDWFDFDRFLFASTDIPLNTPLKLGIVMFCGENPLGREPYHVANHRHFWARQGATRGCSILRPSIPSSGREAYDFECSNCGIVTSVNKKGEKGVDLAIASYLFETADNWNAAFLVARDADYVPAVQSLRRRGKRFFVVVEDRDDRTSLVQSAQSHWPYDRNFLRRDFLYFKLFGPNGEVVDGKKGVPFSSRYEGTTSYGGLELELPPGGLRLVRQTLGEQTDWNEMGKGEFILVSNESMIEAIQRHSPMLLDEGLNSSSSRYDD